MAREDLKDRRLHIFAIIVEAILNKPGAGNFRAFSAGGQPKGEAIAIQGKWRNTPN
jgi:hypothetical protein